MSPLLIAITVPLVMVVVLCGAVLHARQTDRGRAEGLSKRAADRLRVLQQEADRLASEERSLLGELRRLEIDRQLKNEEFVQVTARTEATGRELARTNEQVARLEGDDLAARPELRARLVALYTLGQGRYLRMLLSVSDVRSVGQASRMVASLAELDRERIASHKKRLDELKIARAALQTQAGELGALRLNAERARLAAGRAVDTRDARIASIDSARDLNAQLAGELQAAQQKLQATLRGMTAGSTSDGTALPLRPFRGDLDWPVSGSLRQAFGRAIGGRPASNGIEIAAPEGAPVKVVHDGTVAFADSFSGFGKLVIVDHGGQTFSLYGNLLDIAAASGAHVAHGDVVGTAGPALTSSFPAGAGGTAGLYFELRIDDRPVDPLQWLRRK